MNHVTLAAGDDGVTAISLMLLAGHATRFSPNRAAIAIVIDHAHSPAPSRVATNPHLPMLEAVWFAVVLSARHVRRLALLPARIKLTAERDALKELLRTIPLQASEDADWWRRAKELVNVRDQ